MRTIERALAEEGPLTRAQLRERLESAGVPHRGPGAGPPADARLPARDRRARPDGRQAARLRPGPRLARAAEGRSTARRPWPSWPAATSPATARPGSGTWRAGRACRCATRAPGLTAHRLGARGARRGPARARRPPARGGAAAAAPARRLRPGPARLDLARGHSRQAHRAGHRQRPLPPLRDGRRGGRSRPGGWPRGRWRSSRWGRSRRATGPRSTPTPPTSSVHRRLTGLLRPAPGRCPPRIIRLGSASSGTGAERQRRLRGRRRCAASLGEPAGGLRSPVPRHGLRVSSTGTGRCGWSDRQRRWSPKARQVGGARPRRPGAGLGRRRRRARRRSLPGRLSATRRVHAAASSAARARGQPRRCSPARSTAGGWSPAPGRRPAGPRTRTGSVAGRS